MVKFLIDNKGIFKSKVAKVVAGLFIGALIVKVIHFIKEPSLSYEDDENDNFDQGEYISEEDD